MRRNIIISAVIAVLVISIPIGVYLVQQQTQLKSKAAGVSDVITFTGLVSGNCDGRGSGDCTAASQEVSVSLTDPFSVSTLRLDSRIGVSHARGGYPDRTEAGDFLQYGANDAKTLGFQTLEVYISGQDMCKATNNFGHGFYQTLADCPDTTKVSAPNLTDVVQFPRYKELLDMDFKTIFLTADGSNASAHSYRINRTDNQGFFIGTIDGVAVNRVQSLHDEFFDLAKYLLLTYSNSGKTIILQTPNEMDWNMLAAVNPDLEPSDTAIQNAITYWNTIQDAVNEAKAENSTSTLKLYHACEVNLVAKGMNDLNIKTATNKVVPNTRCDLYGYSAYDTMHEPEIDNFRQAFTYLKEKAPDSAAFGNNNVYVSELGSPQREYGIERSLGYIQRAIEEAFNQAAPYVLFWQLYDNECSVFNPTREDQCRGWWIRKPSGGLSAIYNDYFNKPTFIVP